MKYAKFSLILAAGTLITACAYLPSDETDSRRLSADYTAIGAPENMRAYVYGGRTVIEFEKDPSFLSISDKNGASVSFERVGRFYRMNQHLESFTVRVNGRQVVVNANPETQVFSGSSVVYGSAVQQRIHPKPDAKDNAELLALLQLAAQQLADVNRLLIAVGNNPNTPGIELALANEKLKALEERLRSANAAMVHVTYSPYKTAFKPKPAVARILMTSAKAADTILVRGYTDSYKAGPMDAKIAIGRANGAKAFLLGKGVDADRIKVTAEADGSFLVPNSTRAGKALNRRVEIEFLTDQIQQARSQYLKVASK